VVERNLDAMAAVKLNVFHWHLSDDQGFRVESKRYPRLQQFGSAAIYYTQAEIRAVVAHARERGSAWCPSSTCRPHRELVSRYPQLASGPGPLKPRDYACFDPVMDRARETYRFWTALSAKWQRSSRPYFHVGGDEVNASNGPVGAR